MTPTDVHNIKKNEKKMDPLRNFFCGYKKKKKIGPPQKKFSSSFRSQKKYWFPLKKILGLPQKKKFGPQKKIKLKWYWCYYPHRSRDSVSPVCAICYFWAIILPLV